MADYYDTGTVTVLSGNRTVTGAGTSWAGLIRAGDVLEIGGRQMRVASVESATSLTLKLPAPAAASGAYAIWYEAPSRSTGLQALDDTRRLIEVSEILMAQRGDYAVRSATLNAPPATPVTGDMYVISTAPTGAWAGYAGHLARWTGTGWAFTAATPGTRAYVIGAGVNWQRGEAVWGIVPGVVSALGVSGNISDILGDTFPRQFTASGQISGDTNLVVRSNTTASNAHLWFRNPDGTNRALIYSDINSNILLFRVWPVPGAATYFDMSLRPTGEVYASNNVPANAYALTSKSYVDGELAKQISVDAAINGLGSTIFAANVSGAIVSAGGSVAGANLRYARLEASGAAIFGSTNPGGGTWRACSADVPNNAFGLFRRIA